MNLILMTVICTGLSVNFFSMMTIFPRKRGLAFTLASFVMFTALLTILIRFTPLKVLLGSVAGLFYFPLIVLLLRGLLFQKLFAFFMHQLLGMWQLLLGIAIVQTFEPYGSGAYNRLLLCIVMPFFLLYATLIYLFGRHFFNKLFVHGRTAEWLLYSFGAMLSYLVMMMIQKLAAVNLLIYLLLMIFILWGFFILCFAIINTHEKSKQRYETNIARNIISSGRDHYQKMNELRDALRVMRHDYKYHLSAAHQLLRSGNQAEAENYLSGMEQKLSESELPDFCTNAAINALLVSYAERCSKHHIKYDMKITLPHSLTIPDYDMCIILGNLLENAVEACVKQEDKGTLKMMVSTKGIHLAIMVKNSFNGRLEPGDILPLSSKKDGGLGLKSVQAIAARYDGELITQWDEEIFTAYVLLRLFD